MGLINFGFEMPEELKEAFLNKEEEAVRFYNEAIKPDIEKEIGREASFEEFHSKLIQASKRVSSASTLMEKLEKLKSLVEKRTTLLRMMDSMTNIDETSDDESENEHNCETCDKKQKCDEVTGGLLSKLIKEKKEGKDQLDEGAFLDMLLSTLSFEDKIGYLKKVISRTEEALEQEPDEEYLKSALKMAVDRLSVLLN